MLDFKLYQLRFLVFSHIVFVIFIFSNFLKILYVGDES